MMGEAVPDVAETTALDILFDGIEELFLGDLHFCISPSGDFNYHVQYVMVLVCEEGNIVEGRLDSSVFFYVDTVIWRNWIRSVEDEGAKGTYRWCSGHQ